MLVLTDQQAHFFWVVPSLNGQLMAYGARGIDANKNENEPKGSDQKSNGPKAAAQGLYDRLLNVSSKLTVPHSWFTYFYIFSSTASAVWGHQLYTRGPLFQCVARHTNYAGKPSMTFNQIILVWALFQFQGLRRTYESFKFSKPSKARMSIAYLVIAIMYYTTMNISMWIEGLREYLLSHTKAQTNLPPNLPQPRSCLHLNRLAMQGLALLHLPERYYSYHFSSSLQEYNTTATAISSHSKSTVFPSTPLSKRSWLRTTSRKWRYICR